MELIFAYVAGLLTLINPCVLPVLPIVLATSLQSNRYGPLVLAAGMSVVFVVLGLFVATLGPAFGIDDIVMSQIGAVMMVCFGLVLLVPRLSERFATATAGFAGRADAAMDGTDQLVPRGMFLGGMLLGAVWSPCIGPTLGGAISLASQGQQLGWAASIMIAFSIGVSTIILVLGYGTREAIRSRQHALRALAERSRPLMGGVFVLVGLAILFKLHHIIEAGLLQILPHWIIDLSVSL
jgi:cytochrome c biogenesis protein CcdA